MRLRCWRSDFLRARCKYCARCKLPNASLILCCVIGVSLIQLQRQKPKHTWLANSLLPILPDFAHNTTQSYTYTNCCYHNRFRLQPLYLHLQIPQPIHGTVNFQLQCIYLLLHLQNAVIRTASMASTAWWDHLLSASWKRPWVAQVCSILRLGHDDATCSWVVLHFIWD